MNLLDPPENPMITSSLPCGGACVMDGEGGGDRRRVASQRNRQRHGAGEGCKAHGDTSCDGGPAPASARARGRGNRQGLR